MIIIENEPHRVVPDGIDRRYPNILLAGLQYTLSRTMAFYVGRRRIHTEIFERKIETTPIIKSDLKQVRFLTELDLDRSGAHQLRECNG